MSLLLTFVNFSKFLTYLPEDGAACTSCGAPAHSVHKGCVVPVWSPFYIYGTKAADDLTPTIKVIAIAPTKRIAERVMLRFKDGGLTHLRVNLTPPNSRTHTGPRSSIVLDAHIWMDVVE